MSAPQDPAWRPPHAYVPGATPRHAEDLFDPLKGISEPLQDSLAWQAGLRFLRDGFYWEAHEVWEAVWMAAAPNSAEKSLVQGLIQIANACLKHRMGKPRAAARLGMLAEGHFEAAYRLSERPMGVDRAALAACLTCLRRESVVKHAV